VKVPLLAGTRVVLAEAPDDAVVLRPPPPGDALADVGAAVRDALRYPLSGPPLATAAAGGRRATIVLESPALPIPGATFDPREEAVAAAVAELEAAGIRAEDQTVLVAAGLARRPLGRELTALFSFDFARRFRGRVEVHDAEAEDLVELAWDGNVPLRVHRALVETDVVVVVTAAESVLHGGPAALLAAACGETLRAAQAYSLLETAASRGWRAAVALEAALGARTPVVGVSLALNHPRIGGAARGYPYEPEALDRVARSPLRALYGTLPRALRERVLHSLGSELSVSAVFAGRPSVAHAEALLRAIESRRARLPVQLDAIVVPVPAATPTLPREAPNPLQVANLGLGLALRLWRDAFPLAEGGTAILVNRFHRRFAHPTQAPYRAFFAAVRSGRGRDDLADAERAAAADDRALEDYRAGRSCHPLLPFAEWDACAPAIDRLGAVLVAECRDATAARQLGFVPVHNVAAALEMAYGRSGTGASVGIVLAPPYFPLVVGSAS
jgi:hypothetical protein